TTPRSSSRPKPGRCEPGEARGSRRSEAYSLYVERPPATENEARRRRSARLVDALGAAAPLLVPQHELLDLPPGGLGKIAELHRRRRLEARDVPLAELDDLDLGGGGPDLERHEGLRPLAPFLVGDGDDRALEDRGMPRHRLLHLDGGDVLTARDDDVLLPISQLDVAVGVPDPDVAGGDPAAAE